MAQRKPIFQLKADCDPTEFATVRLTQVYADGCTVKRDVPTMDGASIKAVLYYIREFQATTNRINFGTSGKKSTTFVVCYVVQRMTPIQNCTPAAFLVALECCKSEMILPIACQTLVDYLETLSKPCQMTVEAFVNQLKVMVWYVTDIPFPGPDPPIVQQTKLKNIFFEPSQALGRRTFLHVNDMSTLSLLTLQQFMSQEQEFSEQSQNARDSHNNRQRNGKQKSSSSGGKFYGNGGRNGGRNSKSGRRWPWIPNNP
jgi:uncharacterized membrane protein YgcG